MPWIARLHQVQRHRSPRSETRARLVLVGGAFDEFPDVIGHDPNDDSAKPIGDHRHQRTKIVMERSSDVEVGLSRFCLQQLTETDAATTPLTIAPSRSNTNSRSAALIS